MATLTCPKCSGEMRVYERNGVAVDQCTECRGIFLDRGELERLIDAEQAWHRPQPPREQVVQQPPVYTEPRYETGYGYGHGSGHGSGYGSGHRRKKSFLSELFDD